MPEITPHFLLETLAAVLAIAYLLLAARENLWCWACAFVSSCLYTWLFFDVSLLMESALNVFYVVMAVAGWLQWRSGDDGRQELEITRLKLHQHGLIIFFIVLAALMNGWLMKTFTDAVWPFLDSFTTWGAVITTILVVRKVLENWLYWILIDAVSIWLYVDRGLYQTALLFVAYIVIALFGYLSWRRLHQVRQTDLHSQLI